ncbi:MAG TPA: hybrid sensor histidine kinase/response regulator [Deferrisomatales bacterium]|nr:hybrid sensor histidine kinase/response regulator [Deferrisomatales bacterium]
MNSVDAIDTVVCELLKGHREQSRQAFIEVLLHHAGPHYAERSREELGETTERAIAGYLAILCAGDWGPMDAFIREIAEFRFPLRFPLSEVQRAFAAFREVARPLLTRAFAGEQLEAALGLLARTVDETIQRFSDVYQELHLEEIRSTSRQLAEANQLLQTQMAEVAEAAHIKAQFFANMSHELRSPLNSIIGYTELLRDGIDGPVAEEQARDLEKILSSSHHLLKLINNILDMTKIESGRMEVEPRAFEVAQVVGEAVDTVVPLAFRKHIEVRGDTREGGGSFRTDRDKVKQVLINLLANAVKFTDAGEVVCTAVRDGDRLRFQVRDTGIGIAPEEREKIFNKFYQIDPTHHREHRGTGLGLPLCRMLVALLGGEMALESEPGRGTRIEFWVPLAPCTVEAVEGPAYSRGPAQVLVIEDDPSALELIQKVLEAEGLEAVLASDGAEGLRLARSVCPRAITLDLLMPAVDGWEVLEELKADPATRDIPVVILSCVDRKDRGMRMGADAYLVKPIDRKEFVRVLHQVMAAAAPRAEKG